MQRAKAPTRVADLKDLPMVLVIWNDAAVDTEFDANLDTLPDQSTVVNYTIGFLVRHNRKEITLVTDITPADHSVRWPYGIPRKMVVDIIKLERNGKWHSHQNSVPARQAPQQRQA